MLTSLFGELGVVNEPGTQSGDELLGHGFKARSVHERATLRLDRGGRVIDRHVRDLFVTGSPAEAMRVHFADSPAEADRAAKLITLFDPTGLWGAAVVKSLSDATGQPVERLHVREHGTLRPLAMIERTTVARRLDDSLKIYCADVRSSEQSHAEASLALMERSHLTAVIVGPQAPNAVDAMLDTLGQAVRSRAWQCPTLAFMLPPGAVWIANKISGLEWPAHLQVQVVLDPLTSANDVWNAVLGVWSEVKTKPRVAPGRANDNARNRNPSAPGAGSAQASYKPITVVPSAVATVGSSPAPQPEVAAAPRPLNIEQARQALTELLRTDGLLGCAVVDGVTGRIQAQEPHKLTQIELDMAAAACTQVLRAQQLAGKGMGLVDPVEEVLVGSGSRLQVIRTLSRYPELFMFALLEKNRTHLALARFRMMEVEKILQ